MHVSVRHSGVVAAALLYTTASAGSYIPRRDGAIFSILLIQSFMLIPKNFSSLQCFQPMDLGRSQRYPSRDLHSEHHDRKRRRDNAQSDTVQLDRHWYSYTDRVKLCGDDCCYAWWIIPGMP